MSNLKITKLKIKNLKSGFTLIELLVVIAIIAIIASVVVGFVYEGTVRGRDTRRKENLDQMVKAINSYFSDNGYLPENQTGWCTYISNPTSGYGDAFQADLQPYMSTIQLDPTKHNDVGDYLFYNTDNRAGHYVICANMEQSSSANGNYDYSACTGGAVYNYCLTQ
ncbi:MAG TPA: prepilin-type N-terminal cleavage/methylation domain-containing protein [Candidatus Paceibacterota bacterium]